MTFAVTGFQKPRYRKPLAERKSLKKVGRKGEFWLFVGKVLTKFFLEIGLERRCEKCDGTSHCGVLQPAHSRRRQDIRVNDWYYALRVAVLGNDCHFAIDKLGRRAAEPLIEDIIQTRFKRLGMSDEQVRAKLLKCALEIQEENPGKYDEFLVEL